MKWHSKYCDKDLNAGNFLRQFPQEVQEAKAKTGNEAGLREKVIMSELWLLGQGAQAH